MPELEIPESMKNISTDVSEEIEVPKAPEICLPGAEKVSVKDFDFNLEDTILALNIIDQFVEQDNDNYSTRIEIRIADTK